MAKTGRNEPCPCGSGKKHKRCCLEARGHGAPASLPAGPPPSRPSSAGLGPSPGFEMSAYTIAKMLQDSPIFEEMKRTEPRRAARFWTPERIGALDTEAIVSRLRLLHVDVDREAFAERAAACPSAEAWSLSAPWRRALAGRGRSADREDDFLGLAACELWKRWCPERPSREMLDDWMQEAYDLSMAGDAEAACERWWPVWEVIRDRLEPRMRSCEQAESVLCGTQSIFNWVQDLAQELHNVALDAPRFASLGVQLCREVLAQFPEDGGLFELNFRADLGEFLFLDDRAEEGEAVLAALIEDHPDEAIGYARLSSIVAHGVRGSRAGGPSDVPRAIALLEQALRRPVQDASGWDLQARLEDLRSMPPIDERPVAEPSVATTR